jgi:hypothetical protein
MKPDAIPAFRQRYREQVGPRYSALMHTLFVFGVGLLAYLYLLSQVQHGQALQWLAAPAGLLAFNVAVYLVHRELGHRKRGWASLFYARHTGDHHSFFGEHDMSYDTLQDWRVILFPPWLIVVFLSAFIAPAIWAITTLLDANTAWIFGAHATLGYLLYEFFHTCHHLPEKHWLTKLPWLREMRQLHRLHHRRDLMHTHNFNIVLPLMDALCRTLHWETPSC